jgi:ribosomal protein S18 acetylase RimI-like enzyme
MPTTSVVLRPPTPADVPALAQLHWLAWDRAYRGICDDAWLDTLSPAVFVTYHQSRFRDGALNDDEPFIIAADAAQPGELLGFARAGPNRATSPMGDPIPPCPAKDCSAELYAIYVHPDRQGGGIGSMMWDHLLSALRDRGHRSMCLWVLSDNNPARRFYQSRGGEEAGVAPITLGDRKYDQVAYKWNLNGAT